MALENFAVVTLEGGVRLELKGEVADIRRQFKHMTADGAEFIDVGENPVWVNPDAKPMVIAGGKWDPMLAKVNAAKQQAAMSGLPPGFGV